MQNISYKIVSEYLKIAYPKVYNFREDFSYFNSSNLVAIESARKNAVRYGIALSETKLGRLEKKIYRRIIKESLKDARDLAKYGDYNNIHSYDNINNALECAKTYAKKIGLDISNDVAKIENIAQRKRSAKGTA